MPVDKVFFWCSLGDQLACAAAQGFGLLDNKSAITYLGTPLAVQDVPFTRFNDGACDSKGRFFAGTIENREANVPGRLYKYDPATCLCCVVDEGPFTASWRDFSIRISTTNLSDLVIGFERSWLEPRRKDIVRVLILLDIYIRLNWLLQLFHRLPCK